MTYEDVTPTSNTSKDIFISFMAHLLCALLSQSHYQVSIFYSITVLEMLPSGGNPPGFLLMFSPKRRPPLH
jgi:hypothetical protein